MCTSLFFFGGVAMQFVEVILLIVLVIAGMCVAFMVAQRPLLDEIRQLRDEIYVVDIEGGDPLSPE